ncbi:iron chelate uptake ABC transporter family permease subunit [Tsukamurella sp. 8F]|uniref:FecCD family ABC transporter permease n=1 Tax=unclassified Tsukamurella TaxID=2633480 RepID=UPI0023B9A80D|nr:MULTISPECIES: iron chelate uptake ABC transporter family permease subunit [unclassified Tsukamurella]MDF0531171.1 iron chelate uptake ABC transporter family permease subunit [Tsukamurella sp. 8J]MDF0585882.1 iron chelate uptake ABC transporter family permease subunit [Tsukamurella sp. 8F]
MRTAHLSRSVEMRSVVVCTALIVSAIAVSLLALASGSYHLSIEQVVSALFGGESRQVREIVVEWRLPRVAAGLIFGAALGVSGAMFQSLTRNPLASPDVIGFSTGSYTGALVVMLVTGGGYLGVAGGALGGGIVTAVLVYVLAYRRGVQGFRLIIVGIAVSAMLASLNTWMILRADLDTAMGAAAWGIGSLNGVRWDQVLGGGVVIGALFAVGASVSRPLGELELGDDVAAAHGVRVGTSRLVVVVVGVALTATVTAASGPIAFVALAAPQIARRCARTARITLMPAACTGALLLAVADYAAQHVASTPLPVGVITVVIGGTYLGWLLFREARQRV